jgi:RimJ/RimL family protein N-acetyltransferase
VDRPLTLEPLRVEHAAELAAVADEPVAAFERRAAGPPHWRNWAVRAGGEIVGYVQATIGEEATEVAWVIGERWRGRGYATAAARAMLAQLDAAEVIAHIDPANRPSQGVARKLGMVAGAARDDGEVRWSLAVERGQQRA